MKINVRPKPNANAAKAVENLKKQQPAPLSVTNKAAYIRLANYDQHLELLKDCDIVIEAIAERMEWKTELYKKIAPYLGMHTIFVFYDFFGLVKIPLIQKK